MIFDIIIIIFVIWGAYKGYKNGLITEVCTMATLILGIWGATNFSSYISTYTKQIQIIPPEYHNIANFTIIFLLILVLCFFVTKFLIGVCKAIKLVWLDKIAGIIFGVSKYIIILAILFFIIKTLTTSYYTKTIDYINDSLFFNPLTDFAHSFLYGQIELPQINHNKILETVTNYENN